MRSSFVALGCLSVGLVLTVGCGRRPAPPDPGAVATVSSGAPASAALATDAPELVVGKAAPDFTAVDQDGKEVKLSALKGKPVVVYFYPKDETSGCTTEAKDFRDAWKDYEKKGITIIGISADTLESHKAFAKHHELPFHLLSDANGAIAKTFGVPNHGGILARQTFVIGADGNVKKIYRDVDVSKHASEVLADLHS